MSYEEKCGLSRPQDTTGFHPSQINPDGSLAPLYPGASHFKQWHYAPLMLGGVPVDLYFWNNKVGSNDLLIGIQCSAEDGDYMSPFIEKACALNQLYVREHRNDVIAAYFIACTTLGITPSIAPRR